MCSSTGQFHHSQPFQLRLLRVKTLKRSQAISQQHRHNVDVQLIGKPCLEELLRSACGADDGNIFFTRDRSSLSNSAFDAICHKGKG
jgi:hypothetical protein